MWEIFSPPPKRLRGPVLMNCPSQRYLHFKKATQSGLRMHIMLHGVNGDSHRVPLRNAACRKVARPSRVRNLLPSDSCPPELKASSVMQRFGPESRDGEGRAVHGRSDGLNQPKSKEVVSVFSWLTLQCNS